MSETPSEEIRGSTPWPTEIRLDPTKTELHVSFDDGAQFVLPAEMLRVMSPSAEVQGHSPDQRVTVGGKRNVKVTGVTPVGNYAVQLSFDDRHSTGIFSWSYLYKLGRSKDEKWADYLAELAAKGLNRG